MKEATIDLEIPFKLFADCIPVKGRTRSTINDLGRNTYYLIPNDLYKILKKFDGKNIKHILKYYGVENTKTILEYFKFLMSKELIFFTRHPSAFPKINFSSWKYPSEIYQAIIEIDEQSEIDSNYLLSNLNELNCKFLELRVYADWESTDIKKFMHDTEYSCLVGIDIYIKYSTIKAQKAIQKLVNLFPRINNVFIYNAPTNKYISTAGVNNLGNILLIKQNIIGNQNCGIVSPTYFAINVHAFNKSLHCNSCLNGKISLDTKGNIKNCPSFAQNFGNIKSISLQDALLKRGFKNLWGISKDQIKGCKDCEFRYICTDCRAYVDNPKDIYSKPLKCGYDPVTGDWADWSTNPLKTKAIDFYSLKEVIIKRQ